MPNENTRADSLRLYLCGAASDGGVQADPNASLGGYRSASLETFFDMVVTSPIANVTIDFVGGAHAAGIGSLSALTVDSLAWTPPGGSQGAAVSIATGETKLLEGAGVPGQFILVTRTTAANLTGAASVTLTGALNNVIGFDNVSAAEAGAGDVEYRALILKNEAGAVVQNTKIYLLELAAQQVSGSGQLAASGGGDITLAVGNFNDWPDSGFCRVENSGGSLQEIAYYASRTSTTLTIPVGGRGLLGTSAQAGAATDLIRCVPGCRIAIEAVVAGALQSIADENTAPTGVTWGTPLNKDEGLDIGDMASGVAHGFWIERVVVAGATSQASVEQAIAWSFDAA